jgi:hypothetical protein
VEGGAFNNPEGSYIHSSSFIPYLWAFVGADGESTVPPNLAMRGTQLFTIFTTFPECARWGPLVKTTYCMTLIMNPWTWVEICQA